MWSLEWISNRGLTPVRLFLCGDVMTGRGIDQILPVPNDPQLYEPVITNAAEYLRLAEQATGPIPRPVPMTYIWGDALAELKRRSPDVRIINLETSITTSRDPWRGKEVLYKMHPANIGCLTVAGIDCCVLANNHVLDWGYAGLYETLDTLDTAGICVVGAGRHLQDAQAPAVITAPDGHRVVVVAAGSPTGGVPRSWAASQQRAGVFYFEEFTEDAVQTIAECISAVKRSPDIAIVSLHWGGNWGFEIPSTQQSFAHQLIDSGGADIVYGHSSHHIKGVEVYRGKLILYGCGNFLDDYEGISGYEEFRPDLSLMYFATVDGTSGTLLDLQMVPMQIRHFRLNRVEREAANWLYDTIQREGQKFGTGVYWRDVNTLSLTWNSSGAD